MNKNVKYDIILNSNSTTSGKGERKLEIIKEDAFRKQMKKGLVGGYLLFGDEDYMKAYSVNAARQTVCSDATFALFNDMKIDVMDYSAGALLDALMPMPMMSDKKIVTVNGLNINALRPKELDDLCEVLAALPEYDYNVLLISVPATQIEEGNLPKYPSAALKKLGEYLTLVHFEPISGARLVSWVGKHFGHHGVNASPEVCSVLVEYVGRSMYTLSNETEKLAYYVLQNGRDTVTKQDVYDVCVAEISTDAFTLANAILDGRGEDAMNALAVMKFRRVEPVVLMGEVSKVICDLVTIKAMLEGGCSASEIAAILKMNEYRVKIYAQGAASKSTAKLKSVLSLCTEADMALKLSPQGYIAIEKLICSL